MIDIHPSFYDLLKVWSANNQSLENDVTIIGVKER